MNQNGMLSLIWQSIKRPPSGKPGEAFFLAVPTGRAAFFLPHEKKPAYPQPGIISFFCRCYSHVDKLKWSYRLFVDCEKEHITCIREKIWYSITLGEKKKAECQSFI
ncbi:MULTISPECIES: hypothetical protein [Heyndrickxia]|uniref:hypothetical protein n=1 Tax=Heyndrickxia TaxID=2837504 RepID=UPI0028FB8103|nr:hypothetical protein [Heyndrickxia coagulans]MDT9757414.1 hypothetical protein [Heyndrickxia coagulans]